MDITRKGTRQELTVRAEPYWMRLSKGAYLGFRRGPDTWVARYRIGKKQRYQALHGAVEYDDAKRQAEAWLRRQGSGTQRGTVRDALNEYLEWLRDQGREDTAADCEDRFRLIIWNDPIATVAMHAVTRSDVKSWRNRLRKGRAPRSVNRYVRGVTAGIKRAIKEGFEGSPEPWDLTPLADDTEDTGETAVFLTPDQREALIGACTPSGALFCRGLALTGARPGELAAAKVADLDGETLRLAHRKGRPARLRVRAVFLSDPAFFKAQAKGKLPGAFLFTDPDGKQWRRHVWAREIQEARVVANKGRRGASRIPADASAYSFRHTRISELLQVYGVDPLTVAAQTGTSVAVIEKSYFKFIPDMMREKMRLISTYRST